MKLSAPTKSRVSTQADTVVLLTATIRPPTNLCLAVSSPEERLDQYCQGIQFWNNLETYIFPILFIDNSGYGRRNIRKHLNNYTLKRPSLITIESRAMNEIPKGFHYGYAELGIIDFAFKNIPIFRSSNFFIKATGRLSFPNIEALLDKLPPSFLFAVDARENDLFVRSPQYFITTQLMLFQTQFYYRNMYGLRRTMIHPGTLIENVLYDKLLQYRNQEGAIMRWPVSVPPAGYAAHWEKNYDSPKQKIINFLRTTLRICLPRWWV